MTDQRIAKAQIIGTPDPDYPVVTCRRYQRAVWREDRIGDDIGVPDEDLLRHNFGSDQENEGHNRQEEAKKGHRAVFDRSGFGDVIKRVRENTTDVAETDNDRL